MGDAAQKGKMLVQLSDEELTALVREAVRAELADMGVERPPARAANSQVPGKRTLTTAALAEALGKSTRTIANWIVQGVPGERAGHDWRFNLDEVKAWIAERKKKKAG